MNDSYSNKQLQEVMESAKRMNVELDEAEAIAWLDAIHKAGEGRDIVIDERAGVFGQNIAMLDFSPERLEYFRTIGGLVEFYDVPARLKQHWPYQALQPNRKFNAIPATAIILSGSISLRPPRKKPARFWRISCGRRLWTFGRDQPTN